MGERYDLVIIGAGSGGLTAAKFAAHAGARVALIEKHRIGGDCTWTGCVPSKALLKAARVAHYARAARRFGLKAPLEPVALKAVMGYVRNAIASVYRHETPEALREEGVDVLMGHARFTGAHTLDVAGDGGPATVAAKSFILCTGARPKIPGVDGLQGLPY